MARGQVPSGRHMCAATPGFGEHLFAYQQPQFDADSGKPDTLPAHFCAGCDVVILPHRFPLHAGPIVHHGQRGLRWVNRYSDSAGP